MVVRGLRDINSGPNASAPQGGSPQQQVVMVGMDPDSGSPLPKFSDILAPEFAYGFVFFVTIINILVFIAELAVNWMEEGSPISKWNPGVGPNSNTLRTMRAGNRNLIRDGDYDRLILPIFLHGHVLHLFYNTGATSIFCYRMEAAWGLARTAGVWLFTGFCGCCFSSAVGSTSGLSVGASGAICGMFTCQIAYYLMNWNAGGQMEQMSRQMRFLNLFCICILMVVMGMSTTVRVNDEANESFNQQNIDHWGHFGGLISGFLVGLIAPAKIEAPVSWLTGDYVIYVCGFLLVGSIVGCFLAIFL